MAFATAAREPVVTRVGWAIMATTAGTGALGVTAGFPLLVTLAGTWAAAVLLAGVSVLVRPRLTVARTVRSAHLTVGDATLGSITARNSSRWPSPRLVAVDRIQGEPVELAIASLARGGQRTVRYPVTGVRRGALRLGPVTVERRDLLGIFRRSRVVAGDLTIWVRPRVHPLSHAPAGVVLDVEGQVRPSANAGSAAFVSLREYAQGDDPRRIHWKQSARTGRLMVREHVDADEPTVTVVLDTRASVYDPARFEEAVEVAASFALGRLAGSARDRPERATLRILGEDPAQTLGSDPLDRLAAALQTMDDSFTALLRIVERIAPGGCVVVVTGHDDGTAAALLSRSGRHRLVVVAELRADQDRPAAAHPVAVPRPGTVVLRAETAVAVVAAWRRLGTP